MFTRQIGDAQPESDCHTQQQRTFYNGVSTDMRTANENAKLRSAAAQHSFHPHASYSSITPVHLPSHALLAPARTGLENRTPSAAQGSGRATGRQRAKRRAGCAAKHIHLVYLIRGTLRLMERATSLQCTPVPPPKRNPPCCPRPRHATRRARTTSNIQHPSHMHACARKAS